MRPYLLPPSAAGVCTHTGKHKYTHIRTHPLTHPTPSAAGVCTHSLSLHTGRCTPPTTGHCVPVRTPPVVEGTCQILSYLDCLLGLAPPTCPPSRSPVLCPPRTCSGKGRFKCTEAPALPAGPHALGLQCPCLPLLFAEAPWVGSRMPSLLPDGRPRLQDEVTSPEPPLSGSTARLVVVAGPCACGRHRCGAWGCPVGCSSSPQSSYPRWGYQVAGTELPGSSEAQGHRGVWLGGAGTCEESSTVNPLGAPKRRTGVPTLEPQNVTSFVHRDEVARGREASSPGCWGTYKNRSRHPRCTQRAGSRTRQREDSVTPRTPGVEEVGRIIPQTP